MSIFYSGVVTERHTTFQSYPVRFIEKFLQGLLRQRQRINRPCSGAFCGAAALCNTRNKEYADWFSLDILLNDKYVKNSN